MKLKHHKGFLTILAANFIICIATLINPLLLEKLVYINASPSPFTAISHFFTHANWPHFLGNFLGVFPFAFYLEKRIGTPKFILTWFICGIGSLLAFTLTPTLYPVMGCLGASGACYGIITAACLLVDEHWVFKSLAMALLGALIFPQYCYTVASFAYPMGIAFSAHCGGIFTACLLCATWLKNS